MLHSDRSFPGTRARPGNRTGIHPGETKTETHTGLNPLLKILHGSQLESWNLSKKLALVRFFFSLIVTHLIQINRLLLSHSQA